MEPGVNLWSLPLAELPSATLPCLARTTLFARTAPFARSRAAPLAYGPFALSLAQLSSRSRSGSSTSVEDGGRESESASICGLGLAPDVQ